MADLFHCYDGCGKKAWGTDRPEDTGDSSSDDDADEGNPLGEWVGLCKRLRSPLGRGQGSFHIWAGLRVTRG